MVMLTYQIPEEIRKVALGGEYNTFDLNAFFGTPAAAAMLRFVLRELLAAVKDKRPPRTSRQPLTASLRGG